LKQWINLTLNAAWDAYYEPSKNQRIAAIQCWHSPGLTFRLTEDFFHCFVMLFFSIIICLFGSSPALPVALDTKRDVFESFAICHFRHVLGLLRFNIHYDEKIPLQKILAKDFPNHHELS